MKFTEEYGNLTKEDMAVRTIVEEHKTVRTHDIPVTYELTHSTEGYECAGSCARWTGEKWGVLWKDYSGTTYGQWYTSEKDAREEFSRKKKV